MFYDDEDEENDYIEEILPSDEDDIDEDNVETQIEEKPIQKISKTSKILKKKWQERHNKIDKNINFNKKL